MQRPRPTQPDSPNWSHRVRLVRQPLPVAGTGVAADAARAVGAGAGGGQESQRCTRSAVTRQRRHISPRCRSRSDAPACSSCTTGTARRRRQRGWSRWRRTSRDDQGQATSHRADAGRDEGRSSSGRPCQPASATCSWSSASTSDLVRIRRNQRVVVIAVEQLSEGEVVAGLGAGCPWRQKRVETGCAQLTPTKNAPRGPAGTTHPGGRRPQRGLDRDSVSQPRTPTNA
jgi:hypothetical protein